MSNKIDAVLLEGKIGVSLAFHHGRVDFSQNLMPTSKLFMADSKFLVDHPANGISQAELKTPADLFFHDRQAHH
jgi:hypothetical protein